MKTIDEAVEDVQRRIHTEDPATMESFREIQNELCVMHLVMAIADAGGRAEGMNAKVMRAITFGILIGITTEQTEHNTHGLTDPA